MLISKMNFEHALEVSFEGIEFGLGKYGFLFCCSNSRPKNACVDL